MLQVIKVVNQTFEKYQTFVLDVKQELKFDFKVLHVAFWLTDIQSVSNTLVNIAYLIKGNN